MTPRDRYLRRTYDITEAEYSLLLTYGKGACYICGLAPRKRALHVEHDHKRATRENRRASVRGLACWRCNAGLSHFRDNPELFERAARYLRDRPAQFVLERTDQCRRTT